MSEKRSPILIKYPTGDFQSFDGLKKSNAIVPNTVLDIPPIHPCGILQIISIKSL